MVKEPTKKPLHPILKWCVIPFMVSWLVFRVILFHGTVPTASMVPTIPVGSSFIGVSETFVPGQPSEGSVVYFRHKKDIYIKRVSAISGNVVVVTHDEPPKVHVYKNMASYSAVPDKPQGRVLEVPTKSYFVLGDNASNSMDSRYWDNPFVSHKDIMGRAYLVFSISDGLFFDWLDKEESP